MQQPLPRLKVSGNHRFLMTHDGTPFFYQGDTAWELFHRLNREEADLYLHNRAAKGFNVVQAAVLAELDGLGSPNAYGNLPLIADDPATPNEQYFRHVDYIVSKANSLGLYVAMLPTWGSWWHLPVDHGGIFTLTRAQAYGQFLGRRYKDAAIIWMLGGDRRIERPDQLAIIRAMATGLKTGDSGAHLMTFHPPGGHSSAKWAHREDWLDFDMIQSGHTGRDNANWRLIADDLALAPPKPTLDGEPAYEHHPVMRVRNGQWEPVEENQWFDEYDVRKAAYRAVLAGACGHTYGCHDIWQFWQPGREAINYADLPWREALGLPGAGQIQHLRALVESRPYFSRVPDQSLLESPGAAEGAQVARGADGSYAFIYLPMGEPVTIRLDKLTGSGAKASWYDPRTGKWDGPEEFPNQGRHKFTPPSAGAEKDWVLVLDAING